jgi:hypothetical protein
MNFSELDGQSSDFEELQGMILRALSGNEQQDYCFEHCKQRLLEVRLRVLTRMPDILAYLENLLENEPDVLPTIPCDGLRDKGDFLLGCYWILEQANNNVLDYHHYLKCPGDPQILDHEKASIRFAAAGVIGAQRHYPLWPWSDSPNPFRE